MGIRYQKVSEALKREISNIVHDEIRDARLGFVTIMRVDLTEDLRYARVYFSVFGEEKEKKATLEALRKANSFIRYLVGQRVKLRFVPEITFKLDRSVEYNIRIEQELDKIKEQNERKKNY